MFSTKAFEARGEKWHRGGADICYYRNGLGKKSGGKYYTLTVSTLHYIPPNYLCSPAICL